jgi:glycosyltransferase involved in cell wall biosynthesis
MAKKTLTVVVPIYNEEDVLAEFHARVSTALDSLDLAAEIIFVDGGSGDGTSEILAQLKSDDARVGIVRLSRNFGKEAAVSAGMSYACGDAVAVIDADLQDPPELIAEFVRIWREESVDVVYGQRIERYGESWLKRTTAHLFYRLMPPVGNVKIPRDSGDFRLMDRRAVDALNRLPEGHRFMKGLYTWIGFKQRPLLYHRDQGHAGKISSSYRQLWNLAIEGITTFSFVPLKVATYLGGLIALAAFVVGGNILFRTIFYGDAVAGWRSLMAVALFLGGIQLMFIGIIGEYLTRVFDETKNRPLYLVKSYEPSKSGPDPQP